MSITDQNRPLRVFDKVLKGGLGAGNLGIIMSRHGTGKTARVLVFAGGEKADEAREAGADYVGADDMLDKVKGGWTDFDAVVATPDMMGKVVIMGALNLYLDFINMFLFLLRFMGVARD